MVKGDQEIIMTINKQKIFYLVTIIVVLTAQIFAVGIWPSVYEHMCKNRSDDEMAAQIDSNAYIQDAAINVIRVTESEGQTSWSDGASGIIFGKKGDTYYALTAYHVIHSGEEGYFCVRTSKTPSRDGYGPDRNPEYYSLMPKAKVEFENEASDLAVISFESEDELAAAKISADTVKKGDKIAVIANIPGESFFSLKYGKISTARLTDFKADDYQSTNKVVKHSVYTTEGGSGAAVFNKSMEICGINIGGKSDVFGRFKHSVMIPGDQISQTIDMWRTRDN